MELPVDALGQRPADSGNSRQVVDAGVLHAPESAEMREQRTPPGRADAGDHLQGRRRARLAAPRAMALDREPMRFVANLLQQVQSGMIGRQVERAIAIGKDMVSIPGLRSGPLAMPINGVVCNPVSASTCAATATCPLPPSMTSRSGVGYSPATMRAQRRDSASRNAA